MKTLEQFENKINERLSNIKNDDDLFSYLKDISKIQNVSTRSACILYEQDIEDNNFFREYSELNDEEKQQKKSDETFLFVKPIVSKLKQNGEVKTNLKFELAHCFADKIDMQIRKQEYKVLIEKLKSAINPIKVFLDTGTNTFYFDKFKNEIKINNFSSKNEIISYLLFCICQKERTEETQNQIKIATYFSLIALGFEKEKVNFNLKNILLEDILIAKYLSEDVVKLILLQNIKLQNNKKITTEKTKKDLKKEAHDEPTKLKDKVKVAKEKIKKLQELQNG